MGISEKLGKAAAHIEGAAEDALNFAKTKYEEKVTPEKREEIKEKADKGLDKIEKAVNKASDVVGKEINSFVEGFRSEKDKK